MTNVTPSQMTQSLVNMGYNPDLSAPLIANTYLNHVYNGIPLPGVWEKSTVKDAHTCFSLCYQRNNKGN